MTTVEQSRRFDDADVPGSATGGTGGLIHNAITEAGRLVTAEVQLAKQEITESLHAAVTALVTGTVAIFGIIAFLVMAIVALVIAVPLHWVAALACAGVFLIIAVIGAVVAISRLKRISPLRQTVQTLKEDVEWAKQQLTLDEK
jgi:uncharacterized membrane protein YqjE